MVRRRGVADTSTAAQQDGHLQTPAAHVLDFGDLIDDLAKRVVDEVDEHEVDHGPCAGHARAAGQANKAPFTDGRVTKSLGAVFVEQPLRRGEVSTPFADSLPHDKNRGVGGHCVIERFERRGDEGEAARGSGGGQWGVGSGQ